MVISSFFSVSWRAFASLRALVFDYNLVLVTWSLPGLRSLFVRLLAMQF